MTETQTRLASDPAMPIEGTVVGDRYEIRDVLGEGGFAVVYRAFDVRTKADVAVKVLDPLMSRRREFASRFMREVETVSRLRHHNTITIFDAGETEQGCLYLVMELLEGLPLDTVLESEARLPAERVKRISTQILKSLQEAHSKGIIHRDLKPANVFIANVAGETDYVKVLDFGIAKSLDDSQDTSLTATGQVMCSPHYVAPERVKDSVTVPASDLYSLGVMMIELLEGKPPYEADSPMMLAVKHLSAEPVPLGDVTRQVGFANVIECACQKPLADRYTSALEMLEALQAAEANVASTGTISASATIQIVSADQPTSEDLHEMPERSRTGIYIAIAIALLVIIAAGFALTSLTSDGVTPEQGNEDSVLAAQEAPTDPVGPDTPPPEQAPEAEAPAVDEGDVPGAIGETSRRLALALRLAESEQVVAGTQILTAQRAADEARLEEEARADAERRRSSRAERQRAQPEPTPEPAVVAEAQPDPEPAPEAQPEPEPEPEPEPADSNTRTRVIRELAPR